MINFEDYALLRELVDRRLDPDGYIYVGTADFFDREVLRSFEKLEELDFITQLWTVDNQWVEPKRFYDFREFPFILLPLGQIALMWPDTVVDNAFNYERR